jgi:hypothetical protein
MDKPTKLKKIKTGWRGSGDEYQYGAVILLTSRNRGYISVYEKGKNADGQQLMQSRRYEDYRPFMKRFREMLETKEKELITNNKTK